MRDQIRQSLDSYVETYGAILKAQGMPDGLTDPVYGYAMSHVLFDINQQQRPIGIIGTLAGKVARFKDKSMLEVVPFAHMKPGIAEKAFVEYVLYSRFNDASADLPFIKRELVAVFNEMPDSIRSSLIADTRKEKFDWKRILEWNI